MGNANRQPGNKAAIAFVMVASLILCGATASAWVRSTTDKGTPIFWPGSCTWIGPDITGTPDLPLATVVTTLAKSIANWQTVTLQAGCSYLVINQDGPAAGEAKLDYKNVLKFRTDKWCRPAEPDKNNPEVCYSSAATAITTVFYTSDLGKSDDGDILDADIQMNDINFTFTTDPATATARNGTTIADLENTLTHELGHFQGLDHTCWDSSQHPTAPLDGATGQPIPSCDDVLNHMVPISEYYKITQATMFNYAAAGETSKRMPKTDDIQGICATYPKAKDPGVCMRTVPPKPSGGCTVTSPLRAGTPWALLLPGIAMGGLILRRRRKG